MSDRPEDFLPEGSLVTARIEIVEAITPEGEPVLSWHAATSDGDELDATRFLGLIERAKLDSWYVGTREAEA
ncbi:hypothetical protein [Rhodococcus sp. 5G237]